MKIKLIILFLPLIILMISYCSKPVPTEEIVKARASIEEAQSYNPEGKAKEYLDKAINELKQAHENLPNDNYDLAKEKASFSYNLSRLSMVNVLPDTINSKKDIYEKNILEAEEANAEILAKEDYESAKSFYMEANNSLQLLENKKLSEEEINKIDSNNYNNNQEKQNLLKKLDENLIVYFLANDKLDKAIKSSNIALQTSLTYKDEYLNELQTIKDKLNKAKNYNIEKYEPEKTTIIENQITETEGLIQNNKLKQAYINLQSLKIEAEELYNTAISRYSEDKLKEATLAHERSNTNVNKNRKILGANETKILETLSASKEALDNSRTQHNERKFESSIQYSEEVIKLSQIIDDLIYNSNLAYQRNLKLEEERRLKEEELRKQQELEQEKAKNEQPTNEQTTLVDTTQNTVDENIKLIYTVRKTKPADCLWRIAARKEIYNNPRLWRRIYEANKDQIRDPNLIYPGQKLKILK